MELNFNNDRLLRLLRALPASDWQQRL